jgi:hypothetical protein
MKSPIITREKIDLNLADEVMYFGVRVGAVVAGLIGLWAVCTLAAALFQAGPIEMARGYITAITGF